MKKTQKKLKNIKKQKKIKNRKKKQKIKKEKTYKNGQCFLHVRLVPFFYQCVCV